MVLNLSFTPWVSVSQIDLDKNLKLSVIEHDLLIIQSIIFFVAMTHPTLDLINKLITKQNIILQIIHSQVTYNKIHFLPNKYYYYYYYY